MKSRFPNNNKYNGFERVFTTTGTAPMFQKESQPQDQPSAKNSHLY
jgi:hypothetical protein